MAARSFPSSVPVSAQPAPPDPAALPRPEVIRDSRGTTYVRGHRYVGARFAQLDYRTPGAVFEGFDVERCEFDNVALGPVRDGESPIIVRDCRLARCRMRASLLRRIVVEDCIIDGMTGGFPPNASVLLKHVVIRGAIDALDLRSPRQMSDPDKPSLPALHDSHYATVDWALDISEARFKRCDLGGVPGRLVRRDPETQVLVTRSRVLSAPWPEVSHGSMWSIGIERLLEAEEEAEVFVARRGDHFADDLAMFKRLREAGIAEPD